MLGGAGGLVGLPGEPVVLYAGDAALPGAESIGGAARGATEGVSTIALYALMPQVGTRLTSRHLCACRVSLGAQRPGALPTKT